MEVTPENAIAKLIFWQQLTIILSAVFLLILWGFVMNEIIMGFHYKTLKDDYISILFFIGGASLTSYIAYLPYQSLRALKHYQENGNPRDLEFAFKKQRHFWMSVPIIFLLFCLLWSVSILFLIFSS